LPACALAFLFSLSASGQTPSVSRIVSPPPTPTPASVVPTPAAIVPAPALVAPTPAPIIPKAAPVAPSERIVGIRVVGYQTVSPDTIAHYLGVKVGDPYDPEKIRANFQSLWDVGLLENVSVEAEREAAEVTLVVTIEERPTISSVDFSGNKKLSTSQIKDKLREDKVEIHQGAPLSRGIVRATGSNPTVTCPLHGSMFTLAEGRVLRGPAGAPLAVYDVRASGGRIEVRPRT